MERELLFADKLQELRETAKAQGNLVTKEQVEEAFAEFSLKSDQMTLVYDYLNKHRIGVGEPVNTEEYLTDTERNFLKLYEKELEQIETVSKGEKEALFLSSMAGDAAAQERLLTVMLPQVADVARLYVGQGILLEDLIGEGNVAAAMGVKLLGAFDNPAEAEGALMKMIMEAMEDHIAENTELNKQDKQLADKVNKVADAARKLAGEYGRKVTVEELAAEGKLSEKTIRDALRISGGKIEDLE